MSHFLKTVQGAVAVAFLATSAAAFEFAPGEPQPKEGSPFLHHQVVVEDGDTMPELISWLTSEKVELGTATKQQIENLIMADPANQAALSFTAAGEFRWLQSGQTLTIPVMLAPPVQTAPVAPVAPVQSAAIDVSNIDQKLILLATMLDQVRQADSATAQADRDALRAEYLTLIERASAPVFYASAMKFGLFAEENGLLERIGWTLDDVSRTYRQHGWVVPIALTLFGLLAVVLVFKALVRWALPANVKNAKPVPAARLDDESLRREFKAAESVQDKAIQQLAADVVTVTEGLVEVKGRVNRVEKRVDDLAAVVDFSVQLCAGDVLGCPDMTDKRLNSMKPGDTLNFSAPDENGKPVALSIEMGQAGRFFNLKGVHNDFSRFETLDNGMFTVQQIILRLVKLRKQQGKMPGIAVHLLTKQAA